MARRNKKNKSGKNKSLNVQTNKPVIVETVADENEQLQIKKKEILEPAKPKSLREKILAWSQEKQILSKTFIICFALAIFSYAYFNVDASNRSILAYFGLMLTMVAAYIEILIVRDHLWVIEGSMPESKKWRNLFFNPSTIRKQKFRKIIVLLFALVVFVYIYKMEIIPGYRNSLTFFGLILMITMVYYEILSIRDEIASLTRAMQQFIIEKVLDNSEKK